MAWLQIDQTIRDHHKILDAADLLETTDAHVTGCLVLLWLWAIDNAPDGSLAGISDRRIMSQKFLKFTSESLSASYIPFPRFLMEDSLAGLSNDAKVLYALMLDRASISKVNGFLETDGTIRIYFTVEQAQKKLHHSRQCATRIFHELEFSGLICRKKQGLGKPALITLNYPSNAKLIQPKGDNAISSE